MSLSVDTTKIEIKNSANVVKFDSSNKLVYRKTVHTGTLTMGGGTTGKTIVPLSGAATDSSTLFVVRAKITSCNGNLGASYVGSSIDLSAPLVLQFSHKSNGIKIYTFQPLTAHVQRTNAAGTSVEAHFSFLCYGNGNVTSGFDVYQGLRGSPATASVTFEYRIESYGWK